MTTIKKNPLVSLKKVDFNKSNTIGMIFFINLRLVLLIKFFDHQPFCPMVKCDTLYDYFDVPYVIIDTSIIGQILVYQMAIRFATWHMAITFAMQPTTCIYLPIYLPTIYILPYRLNRFTYLPMQAPTQFNLDEEDLVNLPQVTRN